MNALKKTIDAIIVVFFCTLVSLVFIQVIFRYVLGHSLPWVEEISRYLFVWIIYLGGSITIRKGINMTFDLFIDSLPYKPWKIAFTLVNSICLGFLILVTVLGLNVAYVNSSEYSSMLRLPMGIVSLALPVGGILMIVSQLEFYIKTMKKRAENIC